MDYKKEEIKEYFNDHIIDYDKEWIESNSDDLHHEIFNTDYYIIGTYQAIKWLYTYIIGEEIVADYLKNC